MPFKTYPKRQRPCLGSYEELRGHKGGPYAECTVCGRTLKWVWHLSAPYKLVPRHNKPKKEEDYAKVTLCKKST